jgi:molecular chaperone HscC
MAVIGIDLGTTNSALGVFRDGKAVLVENALGRVLTPSAVAVDESGAIIVGAAALEMEAMHPHRCVSSFKRWMGTDRTVTLSGKTFRAEELSALVLRSLMADFEARHDETVTDAVISCPAYFNDMQRKATINAARLAGLKVERLINEPTAAVLAYGLETAQEGRFLVFDLGGGTFDVSILHKFDGIFEVRASAGDNFLGGDDFTAIAAKMVARKHGLDFGALSAQDRARLTRVAEGIKTCLTSKPEITYHLSLSGGDFDGVSTRELFEVECADLLRRLRAPLERTIRDSVLRPSELDAIVLVGGATRMPMIRQMVARLFGRLPFVTINPDEVVARGATVQAALKARDASVEDVMLTDVCPFTLGIASQRKRPDGKAEMMVAPIIQRNAMIPISRHDVFTTVDDNQSQIKVMVFQGENLKPEHNVHIGSLDVAVPRKPAGQEAIDVRFTYDVNGSMEVEVKVVSTGLTKKTIFSNTSGLSESELEKRFTALNQLKMAPRDQQENRELLARAERLYAEAASEDREMIAQAILTFTAEIEDQMQRQPELARKTFRGLLDRLEQFSFHQD